MGTHLGAFRRAEGRSTDSLLERYRKTILNICSFRDKMAPQIKDVVFVGFGEPTLFSPYLSPLRFDELQDKIYDTAIDMEIPRGGCGQLVNGSG